MVGNYRPNRSGKELSNDEGKSRILLKSAKNQILEAPNNNNNNTGLTTAWRRAKSILYYNNRSSNSSKNISAQKPFPTRFILRNLNWSKPRICERNKSPKSVGLERVYNWPLKRSISRRKELQCRRSVRFRHRAEDGRVAARRQHQKRQNQES